MGLASIDLLKGLADAAAQEEELSPRGCFTWET